MCPALDLSLGRVVVLLYFHVLTQDKVVVATGKLSRRKGHSFSCNTVSSNNDKNKLFGTASQTTEPTSQRSEQQHNVLLLVPPSNPEVAVPSGNEQCPKFQPPCYLSNKRANPSPGVIYI